ncbi:ferritin-like domain-containing protein [Arthrobacter livingstonensis]|uniref:ferritin-like domain-containing protein n=1 Tax=Arthrobacter livingstonensis TaxID=670078 RepID=UPI0034D1C831
MSGVLGLSGAGFGAAALLAATAAAADASTSTAKAPSDASILNFALNLEYLEAEFYLRAVTGHGLPEKLTTGTGRRGGVDGGHAVPFRTGRIRQIPPKSPPMKCPTSHSCAGRWAPSRSHDRASTSTTVSRLRQWPQD